MEHADRAILVSLLLAVGALVAASPVLATAAAGLLVATGVLTALPVLSGSWAQRRLDATRVIEGGTVTDEVLVRGFLRFPAVLVARDELPGIAEVHDGVAVPRAGFGRFQVALRTDLRFPVRGVATFPGVRVETLDALGLTSERRIIQTHDTVFVWPRTDPLREHPLRAKFARAHTGKHLVRMPGTSFEFRGLREYLPSDPMRHVNWKATARTNSLMVNHYEHETQGEVTMFIDARRVTAVGTHRNNPSHATVRIAAGLAQLIARDRDILRAHAFGTPAYRAFRAESGRWWIHDFMDWATALEPGGYGDAATLFQELTPHLTPRSMVVFISPLIGGNPLGDAPVRARALGNSVLVIGAPLVTHVPDALRQSLEAERRAAIGAIKDQGTPVIDMSETAGLEEALLLESVIR